MALGRTLANYNDGKYEGSLMLSRRQNFLATLLCFFRYLVKIGCMCPVSFMAVDKNLKPV